MASTKKFITLHKSLMTLAHAYGFIDRDKHYKIQSIVRDCAQQLQVARVSIWHLDHDTLLCEQLYRRYENDFDSGLILNQGEYPYYFKALMENGLINADDAHRDSRTAEFSESYLTPLGIMSMLDAPIFVKGALYGVVCIEATGQVREWDLAELSYAAAIADKVSLIIEHENWLSTREEMALIEKTDPLTGLANRRHLQIIIEREQAQALVNKQDNPWALILVGIDGFTQVNELHGHQRADHILSTLSGRFTALERSDNLLVSRVGGDKFGFWLSQIKQPHHIQNMVDTIASITSTAIEVEGNKSIKLTAAMGIAQSPQDGAPLQDPIRCAEVALKRAKQQAPGAQLYFTSQWIDEIQAQRAMETALLLALDKGQLRPHYQPLVLAESGQVVGIEALVRWHHPDKGIIAPYHFLPLLAEMGLMTRLGDYMLEQACKDMQRLEQLGITMQWISVNLSAEQLYDDKLAQKLESLLLKYKLPSSALELEVVEELISQESELVKSQLQAIDALGIRLAIDDFGTGYSSLSRLKHLPVSKIKIDKSFVDGLPHAEEDQCIARSIIGLAKGIKVKLVAEGVEHQGQADWLRSQGVDYMQGYLYAKALSFDDLVSYCHTRQDASAMQPGLYDIARTGDIIVLTSQYRWDMTVTRKAMAEFKQLAKDYGGETWASLIDIREGQSPSLEVQEFIRETVQTLVHGGLTRSAFVVGESELASYQMELISPAGENYQRRFFHDKRQALNWLSEQGFNHA